MTKQQFMNYNNEETFCATCNRMLPTKNFMYSYINIFYLYNSFMLC